MIQGGLLQKIDKPAGRPAPGVSTTENDPPDPAMNNCPGTHGAGLLGYVEIAVVQSPVALNLLRLGEGKHLGMCGCVLQSLNLIVGPGNDRTVPHDHGPNGDLFGEECFLGLAERLPHHERVAGKVDDGIITFIRRVADHGGDSGDKGLRMGESVKIMPLNE